jgi:hypothetical protein
MPRIKVKLLYCWNRVPETLAAHHLSDRLHQLLQEGWICRMAYFGREQAMVWVEPKLQRLLQKPGS